MARLALLIALAVPAHAETSCLARVADAIASVRPAFPALDGLDLKLEPYEGSDDFYRAVPRKVWRAPREREYVVMVNSKACVDAPPSEAEKAILAHELAHLERFAAMGLGELAAIGWEYWRRPDGVGVEAFERHADRRAVAAGKAAGLAAYREWLYARLTPERAAVKRRVYLTPEELLSSPR